MGWRLAPILILPVPGESIRCTCQPLCIVAQLGQRCRGKVFHPVRCRTRERGSESHAERSRDTTRLPASPNVLGCFLGSGIPVFRCSFDFSPLSEPGTITSTVYPAHRGIHPNQPQSRFHRTLPPDTSPAGNLHSQGVNLPVFNRTSLTPCCDKA